MSKDKNKIKDDLAAGGSTVANEDFKNDAKDTCEMGTGHSITSIYEIIPARVE